MASFAPRSRLVAGCKNDPQFGRQTKRAKKISETAVAPAVFGPFLRSGARAFTFAGVPI